jgi:hypothetical protein
MKRARVRMKGRQVIGRRRLCLVGRPLHLHLLHLVLYLCSLLPLHLPLPLPLLLLIFALLQCVLSLWLLLPLCRFIASKAAFLPFLRLTSIFYTFLDLLSTPRYTLPPAKLNNRCSPSTNHLLPYAAHVCLRNPPSNLAVDDSLSGATRTCSDKPST